MKVFYLLLTLLFITSGLNAQEKIDATFEASDGKIFIYYELNEDPQKEYEVKVKLKRTTVPSFELIPSVLVGDVGRGKFAGGRRTIIWHINTKEEAVLDGDDFYFEVTSEAIEEGGGIPWYVWAGGAALGGGAAAFFLLSKSDDGGDTQTNFPTPPGRP
mgnify:CR=1 FL=1